MILSVIIRLYDDALMSYNIDPQELSLSARALYCLPAEDKSRDRLKLPCAAHANLAAAVSRALISLIWSVGFFFTVGEVGPRRRRRVLCIQISPSFVFADLTHKFSPLRLEAGEESSDSSTGIGILERGGGRRLLLGASCAHRRLIPTHRLVKKQGRIQRWKGREGSVSQANCARRQLGFPTRRRGEESDDIRGVRFLLLGFDLVASPAKASISWLLTAGCRFPMSIFTWTLQPIYFIESTKMLFRASDTINTLWVR